MLTFEQLKPALYKWAGHYCRMGFDIWELINEVWCRGDVQKLDNIEIASNAIRCNMIDYIRDKTSYRKKQRWEKLGWNYPDFISTSSIIYNDDGKPLCLEDTFEAKVGYCKAESKDLFNFLTRGFNRTEKLIIRLRYEYDFTMSEIADVIGLTESRVSQLHTEALKRIRVKLFDMEGDKHKLLRSYKYRRDPLDVNSYNRMYYQKNKGRIQEQRVKNRQQQKEVA